MAEETQKKPEQALPPKLDLRRAAVLKKPPAPEPVAEAAAAEGVKSPPEPASPAPASPPPVPPPAAAPAKPAAPAPTSPKPAAVPAMAAAKPANPAPSAAAKPAAGPSLAPRQPGAGPLPPRPPAKPSEPAATPAAPTAADEKKTVELPSAPRPSPGPTASRPTLRPTPTGASPAAKPAATEPEKAPAADVKPPAEPARPAAAPARPVLKKETSRIPLSAAKPPSPTEAGDAPKAKTIFIKPSAPIPTIKAAPIDEKLVAPAEAASPETKAAEKRKTSRISLESALTREVESAPAQPAAKGAPKTIRLKTPTEAPTVKVGGGPAAPEAAESEPAGTEEKPGPKPPMGKTARIDLPPAPVEEERPAAPEETEEGVSPTRKKTIRLKRPDQKPAVRSISVARAAEEGKPEGPIFQVTSAPGSDDTGWVFPVVALVATLVACVVVYVLAAQAFGPNVSLSQISYGSPGMNLPWPGKVVPR